MVDRPGGHAPALGLDQGRDVAVHVVETRQAQIPVAPHHLETAAGIRDAVPQQQIAKTVGQPGREALDPVIPAIDAVTDKPHLVLVGGEAAPGLLQHGGNVGRIVLAIPIKHHQPVAAPLAHAAQHRHALADGPGMTHHPQRGELRLQTAEQGVAVVLTAIVHIDQLVAVFPRQRGIDLADEGGQIVPLILGGHHDRDLD
ncbi:hypothetical protein D3C79_813270 [compost metagenome]